MGAFFRRGLLALLGRRFFFALRFFFAAAVAAFCTGFEEAGLGRALAGETVGVSESWFAAAAAAAGLEDEDEDEDALDEADTLRWWCVLAGLQCCLCCLCLARAVATDSSVSESP